MYSIELEKTVSAFDAKTHLSQLLHEVENGKSILITRRGKPVARLVHVPDAEMIDFTALAESMSRLRNKIGKPINVKSLKEEGKRR